MAVLAWLLAIVIAVVVIAIVIIFLNRFYRKSTRDMALVRTGFGGQRILISGGCLALPFLHKVEEINMRTLRIEVRRTADKSAITEDRMRVDVELEFYVRVIPSHEGIATAAQALGAKSFTVDGIRNLLEGRFIDAVLAVAARHTMDSLHEGRAEFVAEISSLLRDNLKQNGILLDSVSLTRLDQSAFSSFDENNAFNAVGLRKLAEIIAVNRKKRAEIEADADVSVRQTQLEATKQRLILTQQEEQAQIDQHLEIEKMRAASDAEAAKAREAAMIASDEARIDRERQTRSTELAKQSELRRIELDSQLAVEVKKVDNAIQLAAKHIDEAKSRAQAELARTEVVLAEEHVQTERDRAVADRSHEMALKRVNEQGAVEQAKAETEADVLLRRVRAESEAVRTKAESERSSLLAKSEGERAVIDAENSQSEALIHMKLEQYRLDRLPEIVSQMMKPAEKIDSIRIHQLSGFGSTAGAPAGNGEGSPKTPINQVMDSILGMALQLPALKSVGDSIGLDFSSAVSAPSTTSVTSTAAAPIEHKAEHAPERKGK
jgi:flotillin